MTEQQACTPCGAGGHLAAQCKWGESLKLLRDLRQPLLDASMEYDEALSPFVGRIDSILASQQGEKHSCKNCLGVDPESCMFKHPEQAEGAQGEREAFNRKFGGNAWNNPGYTPQRDGWEARAALAQPSLAPELDGFAEALRTEVERVFDYGKRDLRGCMNATIEQLQAQHDRIVGVRAEAICLLADSVGRLRAERDVALAAIAQLHSMLGVTDQVQAGERIGFLVGQSIMVPKLEAGVADLERSETALSECCARLQDKVAQDGQVPEVLLEAIKWADHLLFECGALVQTRAPSVHVYNQTYAAVEAAKAVIAAAPAQGGE